MVTVSVIIPAYNEENRIENTLNSINEFFKKEKDDYEILIIDDGSIDSTAPRVENLGLKNSSIKLIRSSHAGKAVAVKIAVGAVRGKYCLLMDADGAADINELSKILALLKEEGADVAIASREGKLARRINEPWYRHRLGRIFNQLVKIILGLRFEDTQCGFKLFRTEVLRTLAANSFIMNKKNLELKNPLVTAFDVELLVLAKFYGYRIIEVPINWTFYPTRNINPWRDSISMFVDLLTVKKNLLLGLYQKIPDLTDREALPEDPGSDACPPWAGIGIRDLTMKKIKKVNFILLAIIITASWLRFYNLDWSKGIVWHPDERNMAVAVEQMRLPERLRDLPTCYFGLPNKVQPSTPPAGGPQGRLNLQETTECNFNPKFFAYGGFPLYLSFVTGVLYKSINTFAFVKSLNFLQAIIFLRIISASASVLVVFLSYLLAKTFLSQTLSILTAILVTFTPGLIQAAHFGTTESLISLLLLSTTFSCLKYCQNRKDIFWGLTTISVGLALATKISSIIIISVPMMTVFALIFLENDLDLIKRIYFFLARLTFLLFFSALIFFLASPYNFLSFRDFRSSMNYEGPVALGTLPVFYTRQFIETLPLLFHLEKILPYAVGPHLTFLGLSGLIVMITYAIAKRSLKLFILPLSFLSFFLPNSLIFAKWTRFISPTFPYFAIFSVFVLSLVFKVFKGSTLSKVEPSKNPLFLLVTLIITSITVYQGLSFFHVYTQEDVRYTASRWIYENIPSKSFVLSETANVSDIPILPGSKWPQNYQLNPVSFNFYDLDQDQNIQNLLVEDLEKSDFIFIPSRRIFKNHLRLTDKYPILSRYYQNLFNGNLGFAKVAQFSSSPQLSILNYQFSLNDEAAEETFTVFDHPVVRIYRKIKRFDANEYKTLIGIK